MAPAAVPGDAEAKRTTLIDLGLDTGQRDLAAGERVEIGHDLQSLIEEPRLIALRRAAIGATGRLPHCRVGDRALGLPARGMVIEVHRHRQPEAVLFPPAAGLPAGLEEHPFPDGDDEARLLADRDEVGRADQPLAGVGPPHQRRFHVELKWNGGSARGEGNTIKAAEAAAAQLALEQMEQKEVD